MVRLKDHYHRAENVDDGRDTFYDRWEHERDPMQGAVAYKKAGADLEQLLDFRHRALIDLRTRSRDRVGLDYGVVMRHDHLHISGGPLVGTFECRAFRALRNNGATIVAPFGRLISSTRRPTTCEDL